MVFKKTVMLMIIGLMAVMSSACTVKAVGDPNRPITINAHIVLDVNGLKDTATDIEDYVSGKKKHYRNNGLALEAAKPSLK